MVIPLSQPDRRANCKSEVAKQGRAKKTPGEAETKFIQIGLQVVFRQAMISAQYERLGVSNHDMQPMEQTGIGIVSLMLMGKVSQGWDVAAIPVAADHTAFCKGGFGKFSDGGLLDIGCDPHFQILWSSLTV